MSAERCQREGCAHAQDTHDAGRGPCGILWCPCLQYHAPVRPGMFQSWTEALGKLITWAVLVAILGAALYSALWVITKLWELIAG